MWGVGRVGINMELCGYSKRVSALIFLRHFPYVEVYQVPKDGRPLNDGIDFPKASNPDNLADPLIKRLWEAKGDTASSIEVMMKFYRADVGAKQKLIAKLNKKAQLIGSQQAASDEDIDRALEMQMRKRLQTEIDDKKTW